VDSAVLAKCAYRSSPIADLRFMQCWWRGQYCMNSATAVSVQKQYKIIFGIYILKLKRFGLGPLI